MEICFWLRLYDSDLDIGCFNTYPIISGNLGVTNTPYTKNSFDSFIRNLGIKMGIFTMKSKASRLFWKVYKIFTKREPYANITDLEKNID